MKKPQAAISKEDTKPVFDFKETILQKIAAAREAESMHTNEAQRLRMMAIQHENRVIAARGAIGALEEMLSSAEPTQA